MQAIEASAAPTTAGKDERRLTKVMIGLMRQPEFALFSGVMMCGQTTVRDDIATAATDGYNIFFGRQFLRKLDEKMIAFVVMHETLHKAFRHLTIYKKLFEENASLTNCAADYVINLYLVGMDPQGKFMSFPMVDGKKLGLLDNRFAGMNTKQVFDILKKEEAEKPKQPGGGDGGQNGDDEGDDSGMAQGPGGAGDQPGTSGADGGFDDHMWGDANKVSKETQDNQAKELDRALRQGQAAAAKLAGKGSNNLGRELGDLLDPQIDWKEQLREFVQATCSAKDASSWRKVNRRFISQDIYLPSLIGESVRHIVVGADASGSTFFTPTTIPTFLTETKAAIDAVNPEIVHLIYWDTLVTGVEVYDAATRDNLVNSTEIKGGGGTNPATSVEAYLKKERIKPECIIMLTDGYVPNWGSDWEGVPILWVIAGHPDRNLLATTGKTIHINDGEH
jgi:predicted metal-dependent peptidase